LRARPRSVNETPPDAAAALAAGSVTAWSTWAPYIPLLLEQGGHVVVEGSSYTAGTSFEVANRGAITSKRPILVDFLQREAKALDWAASHVDDYSKVLARETGLPLTVAHWVAEKGKRRAAPIDAALVLGQREVLDTFAHAGAVEAKYPLSEAFMPGLVKLPA